MEWSSRKKGMHEKVLHSNLEQKGTYNNSLHSDTNKKVFPWKGEIEKHLHFVKISSTSHHIR